MTQTGRPGKIFLEIHGVANYIYLTTTSAFPVAFTREIGLQSAGFQKIAALISIAAFSRFTKAIQDV